MTFNEFFNNKNSLPKGEYINLDLEYFEGLKPKLQAFMVSSNSAFIIDGDEYHDTINTIYRTVFNSISDGQICIIDPNLIPCPMDKKSVLNSSGNTNGSGNATSVRDNSADTTHYATVYTRTGQTTKKHYYNTWDATLEFINQHRNSLVLIVGGHALMKDTPCFYKNILTLDVPKTIIALPGSLNKKTLNGFTNSVSMEFFTLPKITQGLMVTHIKDLFRRLEITYDNKSTLTAIAVKAYSDVHHLNSILHTLLFQMYLRRDKFLTASDIDCLDASKGGKGSAVRIRSSHTHNIMFIAIPAVIITIPLTLFSYSKWDYAMDMVNANKNEAIVAMVDADAMAGVNTGTGTGAGVNADTGVDYNNADVLDVVVDTDIAYNNAGGVVASIDDGIAVEDEIAVEDDIIIVEDDIVIAEDGTTPPPTLGSALLEMEAETIVLPSYGIVRARVLNLRSNPSLNSRVVAQSPRNTRLEVVDSHSQADWVMVRNKDGVTAWVAREFLTLER